MNRRSAATLLLPAAIALAPVGGAAAGVAYTFTVNQTTSSLTYSFNASAPFTGAMVGANDPLAPAAERTRTKRMANILQCSNAASPFTATTNDTINISGTIAANGSSSSSPPPPVIRPGGTFKLGLNTAALTCTLQDFNVGSSRVDLQACKLEYSIVSPK